MPNRTSIHTIRLPSYQSTVSSSFSMACSNLSKGKLAAIALLLDEEEERTRKKRRRRVWVNTHLQNRKTKGEYWTLFKELIDDEVKFYEYFRMPRSQFYFLLHKIEKDLMKQNTTFREAISPEEKLAVFLRMSSAKKLEVCVDSVASAMAAVEGGADRLELCAALSEGGLTPTLGLLTAVKKFICRPVDVYCMVRPRGGPMTYSQEEIEVILSDADDLKKAGADGLVFGALNSDGTIDVELCRSVQEASGDLPCTFHRAFDLIPDPLVGLETVISLGYKRILTSGGQASALEGSETLEQLVGASKGRILIMAGAGIKSSNVATIVSQTNVQECHASARVQRVIGSPDKSGPKMGQGNDNVLWVTCQEEVKMIKRAMCSSN